MGAMPPADLSRPAAEQKSPTMKVCSTPLFWLLGATVCCLLFPASGWGQQDDTAVLREVADHARRSKDTSLAYTCTFRVTVEVPSRTENNSHEWVAAVNGRARKVVSTKISADPRSKPEIGTVIAYVTNENYSFQARRKPGSREYLLDAFIGPGSRTDSISTDIDSELPLNSYSTALLSHYPVDQLIDHPTFRLKSISREQASDGEVVIVAFESDPSKPYKLDREMPLWKGKVFGSFAVRPDLNWAIDRLDLTFDRLKGGRARWRGLYSYSGLHEGVPILTSAVEEHYRGGKDLTFTIRKDNFAYDWKPPRPEEFTLSYFDLPEPVGTAGQPRSPAWYWWLFLAAAGFGALFVVFRRMARRTPPSSTTEKVSA